MLDTVLGAGNIEESETHWILPTHSYCLLRKRDEQVVRHIKVSLRPYRRT